MTNSNANQPSLTREQALEIAKKKVAALRHGDDFVVQEAEVLEKPFGWVIFYTTKKYAETKDPKFLRPGNAPFIIERSNGAITQLPSSMPPSKSIDEFEKKWRKNAPKP